MKKILFLIVIMCGCSDILEENPKGQVIGNNALKSINGLEAALTGAYRPWINNFTSGFSTSAIVAVQMGSDDLTTHPASNKAQFREFDQFTATEANDRMPLIWAGCFKAIQGANNVINNYEALLSGPDEARAKQIAGEAYFARAYSYYWLVRLWNKVPLLTTPDVTDEVLSMSSAEPQETYALIVSDLEMAEDLMAPLKREPGRPSSGSASAVLADVYLTMGGYPVNDASSYAKAAAKAKEVMDNKATYGFDLVPTLGELWNGIPSTGTPNGTPEEVFALHFCGSCDWTTGQSLFGIAARPGDEGGWDDYFPELNFFNNFPAGARFDATFYTSFLGGTIPWQNSNTKHPYYKKFQVSAGDYGWYNGHQIPLVRYAHVLLIYAEAIARANGNADASAYAAINAIRQRAGLADLEGLSNSAFIDAVIQERAWEFAGEYTRWFDLTRLEMIDEANAGKHADDIPVLGTIKTFLPYPALDISVNPNIGG